VLLRAFAAGLYGVFPEPVCGDAPRCEVCPLSSACVDRNRPRRGPASFEKGQDPTELLAAEGAAGLTAEELMYVLASEATKSRSTRALDACKRVLRQHGGLRGVAQLDLSHAAAALGERGARRLVAAMELARRWAAEPRVTGKVFGTGADFYNHYRLRLRDLKQEVFIAVILDQKTRFLAEEFCSQGTLTASLVHPREAFRRAIKESAAAIAFVHNHPSGNPQPSTQDRDLTTRLAEVSRIVGIRLVDHVVIGDGAFVSFAERGWL
jgi:DNA repair protein RadC